MARKRASHFARFSVGILSAITCARLQAFRQRPVDWYFTHSARLIFVSTW
jgi:hypothetical protein